MPACAQAAALPKVFFRGLLRSGLGVAPPPAKPVQTLLWPASCVRALVGRRVMPKAFPASSPVSRGSARCPDFALRQLRWP
eukprot:12368673-Alexandrium_andersonii.AAC.1